MLLSCKYYAVAGLCFLPVFQNVSWLASQLTAYCFKRGEAYGLGLAGLQNRQISLRKLHSFGQLAERNFPLGHLHVEVYYYFTHTCCFRVVYVGYYIVSSCSSFIFSPIENDSAITRENSPKSIVPVYTASEYPMV